jgi:hypothetical protein
MATAIIPRRARRQAVWLLLGLGLGLALAAAGPAAAQRGGGRQVDLDEGAGVAGQGGRYGPGMLTPAQLEACLRTVAQVNRNAPLLDAEDARLREQRAELRQLRPELVSGARRIDRSDPSAVATYNQLIEDLRVREAAHAADVETLRRATEAHERQAALFDAHCARRRYYVQDMQAVRARLGLR